MPVKPRGPSSEVAITRAVRAILAASFAALSLTLPLGQAEARAGDGGSFGSRGSMTWSAPPSANTAPYSAPSEPEAPAATTPANLEPRPMQPRPTPVSIPPGREGSGSPP